jgi:hypothetical protein
VKEAEADDLVYLKDKYCKLIPLDESGDSSRKVSILLQTHLLGGKVQKSGLRHDKDVIIKVRCQFLMAELIYIPSYFIQEEVTTSYCK